MARIKYTALVENIRGSIQGTTFQRNAYGYTVKAKPNMVNPNRLDQAQRKANFSDQARKWRALTEADRAAWESYAAAFPLPSRLNPDSNLNGFNYFVKWHSIYNQGGNVATLNDPGNTQGTISYSTGDLILDGSDLLYEGAVTVTGSNWRIYVYLTQPIPFGQEYIRNTPRFMDAGSVTTGFSVNLAPSYLYYFGALPQIGDWVGLKVIFIRSDNGQIAEFPALQVEVIA